MQELEPMAHIILADKKLVSFEGPDAAHLLQSVLTCNIETLQKGVAQIGALLSPQGKILFELLISKQSDDRFLIEIDADQAASFKQRMTMYRMRSQVEISEPSESLVRISWDDDSTDHASALRDVRFRSGNVFRSYLSDGGSTDRTEWDRLRIEQGVPEAGRDYALGDAFAHDVSFDQNGGVDFKKGCYIGQEIVSRMHHRATARRRFLIASFEAIPSGVEIVADGKPLGALGTTIGNQALALCRIDRVKEAIDVGHAITVGGTQIALRLPPHVSYDWPNTPSEPSELNDA
ncbi:MAG: folate-binding protein [Ahrensia sp.]|nr:folate-binding protein [Ahrensia sp.]